MTNLHLLRKNWDDLPPLDSFDDHTIYQTRQWINFVSAEQNAEPVYAAVVDGKAVVGRFAGLIVKKYGLPILGSPFPGWTTSYMGFNLEPSISRTDAMLALEKFAFGELKCVHFELMDRRLSVDEVNKRGYQYKLVGSFEIDLNKDEDELFASMRSNCRRSIRRASKLGVKIEEANDLSFVDDYYSQMQDVFAKQKLVPTYSKGRIRTLVKHLLPTGRLLLVRARNSEGKCIATGIFPAMNDTAYFWGGASYRPYQNLRPNEAVQWFAIRYWKARAVSKFDFGGGGEYKRKYGGFDIAVPWVRKSKYPIFERLRNGAKDITSFKQRLCGIGKT